jgi:WD40 repeat protein
LGTLNDEVAVAGEPKAVLRGHTNTIANVSWNAAGDRIVSASSDGSAKIWDPVTGKPTITLTQPEREPLHLAAWSPNGERLLTVSEEGRFKIWDASRGYAEERLRVLNGRAAGKPDQPTIP